MIEYFHTRYDQRSQSPDSDYETAAVQLANLAQRIKADFDPQTVLDIGCADGLLIKQLHDLGIQAWGLHWPDERAELPSCQAAILTAPFPQHYDLIVCLEYLHSAPIQDTSNQPVEILEAIIANICRHTNEVIFSSPPPQYAMPNISPLLGKLPYSTNNSTTAQSFPPEIWAEFFARQDFYHDLSYEVSPEITWGMRFFRATFSSQQIVASYENHLWVLRQENQARRNLLIEMRTELSQQADQTAALRQQVDRLQTEKNRLWWPDEPPSSASLENLRSAALTNWHKEHLLRECELILQHREQLVKERDQLIQEKNEIQMAYTEILNSASWRFMRSLHKVRHRLIPPGSQRERWLRRLMGHPGK